MAQTTSITPSVLPGNFYSPQTIAFSFSNQVTGVALTEGLFPPSLSKYIAYDTLTPPNPFIAVTEDGNGRVVYDGGFPKLYNGTIVGTPTTFDQLNAAHKYTHNAIKWIANPNKPKKILVLGDSTGSYRVKYTGAQDFLTALTKISNVAGYVATFKDITDYGGNLDATLAELEEYAAIILLSSNHGAVPLITTQCVNNIVEYRENGSGVFLITDHGYILNNITDVTSPGAGFFKTANMVASRFGAYFTGDFNRVPVNVGFLRSTYGDHPLYNGMLDSENIAAGGSESKVVVTTNIAKPPNQIQPVTTSSLGVSQYNMLASMSDGSLETAKFRYNIQSAINKPFELTITNAGKILMDTALANNTPITNFELWSRPGVTAITPATTVISGMTKMDAPDVGGSVSRKSVSFFLHIAEQADTFYPRTLAIMSGATILGAVSIDIINGFDSPAFLPLLMKVDPKVFINDASSAYNDIVGPDGFNKLINVQEKQRKRWMPTLYNGQTLYGQGIGVPAASESTLVEVDIITTPAEFETAKLNVVSMQDVFNTWDRFSHHASGGYSNSAYPAELLAWQYDSVNDVIRSTVNSASQIGFISPKNYKNFDLDVTMGSTHHDDDLIGLVACADYLNTSNGNELHKIDYWRSCGGNGIAGSRYNAGYPGTYTIANRYTAFKWGNGNYGANATEAGYVSGDATTTPIGWQWHPGGTRIRIERRDNIVTMRASDLDSNVLIPASEVVIDLSADTRLQKFMGGSRYGFICGSQPDSYWKINSFTDHDKVIVNITTNTVYAHNGTAWFVTGQTPTDVIKPGRFAYSNVNKKLYYRDVSGVLIDLTN